MGRSAIPKYRRRSDGYAFVEHHSIPTKTHRLSLGKYGTPESLAAYKKFINELDGARVVVTVPGKWPAIDQMVEAYLIYAERRYMRPDGLTSEYHGMVSALATLEPVGRNPSDKFTVKTLTDIQRRLAADGYLRSGVNHIISRLKKFIRWCCKEELCPGDLYSKLMVVGGLRKGEENCAEPEPIGAAEIASINGVLQFVPPTVATMIQVQFKCGLRPNEVCRMRVESVDFGVDPWLYYPEKHKNDWREAVAVKAIPASAQQLLKPYLTERPYFFRTLRGGERYTTSGYRQAIESGFEVAAEKGVDLRPFRPNQLRHAIATHVAQRFGHRAAQVWCGHDQPNTTAIYIEQQAAELTRVSQLLEADWNASA